MPPVESARGVAGEVPAVAGLPLRRSVGVGRLNEARSPERGGLNVEPGADAGGVVGLRGGSDGTPAPGRAGLLG